MKSQNTKSSSELQKEVHKEIRNVRRDIDELQGRLSPGQLIDDVIFYPKERNLSATMDHLKRNPVGTAFLSLGTILLMEDDSHRSYEENTRKKILSARDDLSSKAAAARESIETKASELRNKASNIKSKASGLTSDLKEKVNDVKGDLTARAHDTKTRIQENIHGSDNEMGDHDKSPGLKPDKMYSSPVEDARIAFSQDSRELEEKTSNAFKAGKEKILNSLSEGKDRMQNLDPMTYMALGAGLGMLTGSTLPVSDKEEKIVDDNLSSKFLDLSEEFQKAINESSNLLKDLVIQDVKDKSFNIFK